MSCYIHGYTFFVFVFTTMQAPKFESIFECISDGVNKVIVLFLVLVPSDGNGAYHH